MTAGSPSPESVSPSPRRWAGLAVLVGAILLLAIDGTVLYLAVPSLTLDLEASAAQVLWIGDIYSLAIAGLLVTMGTLADRIGRKRLLLSGAVAFGLASLLAAFAPTAEALIAARFLLGLAGASLMPSTLALIRAMFPDPKERTRAIAVWSAAAGGGGALGPLVGGVLLEHFWWGSVFLINVPVVVALVVGGLFLLPESKDRAPGPFDLPSALLSMATTVPLVYAVKHAVDSGFDAVTAGGALLGLLSGLLFVRRQRRLSSPMLDVELFRNPAFSGAVLTNFISIFALTGLLYFFSQYLQLARGYSPLVAGLAELPATLASMVVVLVVGVTTTRLGMGRSIALAQAVAAVGLVLVAMAESADHYLWLGLAIVPVGLGAGLAMTLSTDAVVSAVPAAKAGAASSISETAYELGVALGVAVLGSLMTLLYRDRLQLPEGTDTAAAGTARESLASALHVLSPGSEAALAAQHAFVSAMQTTAVVAGVITAVSALVAWRTIPSPVEGRPGA